MNIITISREFGSGGRELGKRLADLTGYDYYDSEILSAVAKNSGKDARYVETALANRGWQNYPITFRGTLNSPAYIQSSSIQLLLEQKKVIREIAALGRDCIIVGRNADVFLREYEPFNIFVCADRDAKVRRCAERALVLPVICIIVMPMLWKLDGVWYSLVGSEILGVFVSLYFLLSKRKKYRY